jgi:hypothetical protein
MNKETKIINVTCKGSRGVPRRELEGFQGNLVELRQENFKKLRRLIIEKGFRFPVYVWEKENKIIDGHQRLFVLKHLIENEGYQFPHDVPVCDIQAKDEKEAKELVLIARSEYGDTSDEGLFEFLEVNKLSFDDLKGKLELPGIVFDDFEKNFLSENPGEPPGGVEPGPELDFTHELMESHNYLILYFDNEIDWQTAQEKFRIKTVKTRDSTDTYLLQGKGRVLKGVDIMERLHD